MSSNEPLTLIAIESFRAIASDPRQSRIEVPLSPTHRLELLNAILLRDEALPSRSATGQRPTVRNPTRL